MWRPTFVHVPIPETSNSGSFHAVSLSGMARFGSARFNISSSCCDSISFEPSDSQHCARMCSSISLTLEHVSAEHVSIRAHTKMGAPVVLEMFEDTTNRPLSPVVVY